MRRTRVGTGRFLEERVWPWSTQEKVQNHGSHVLFRVHVVRAVGKKKKVEEKKGRNCTKIHSGHWIAKTR